MGVGRGTMFWLRTPAGAKGDCSNVTGWSVKRGREVGGREGEREGERERERVERSIDTACKTAQDNDPFYSSN